MIRGLNININKILIGAVVISILTIAGLLTYNLQQEKTPREKNLLTEQMDSLSDTDKYKYQEQMAVVIAKKDFSACDAIKDRLYHTVCINNIALNLAKETKDITYCQKIDNKLVPIDECERNIIFEQSIGKEDASICRQTKNQELQKQCQNNFYIQLAIKKEDIFICDQAPEDQREFCHDNFYVVTKSFRQNPTDFDCSLLKGEDAKIDCDKLKEESNKDTQKTQGANLCQGMKSNLFSMICFSLGRFNH